MELYHGSTEIIQAPIILEQQRFLDFGKGFYLTSSKEQAIRWAHIKSKRIGRLDLAVVNVYKTETDPANISELNVRVFNSASEEWLDFILKNRNGNESHSYDLIKGPVANDTLYRTLALFESGILTKKETIVRLKTHKLFDQISFHSSRALKHLRFEMAFKAVL